MRKRGALSPSILLRFMKRKRQRKKYRRECTVIATPNHAPNKWAAFVRFQRTWGRGFVPNGKGRSCHRPPKWVGIGSLTAQKSIKSSCGSETLLSHRLRVAESGRSEERCAMGAPRQGVHHRRLGFTSARSADPSQLGRECLGDQLRNGKATWKLEARSIKFGRVLNEVGSRIAGPVW